MPAPSPSRRRPAPWLSIILFLLLGAILNILLAWSLCISPKSGSATLPLARSRAAAIRDLPPSRWPYPILVASPEPSSYTRSTSWRLTTDFAYWNHTGEQPGHPSSQSGEHAICVTSVGLPLRSLRCVYEGEWSAAKLTRSEFLNCFRFDAPFAAATLPYAPIWPGFLLNTLIFASLSWLLLRAPRHIRRTLRKRSHRCLACGYPRAGLAPSIPCPECGQPMTP